MDGEREREKKRGEKMNPDLSLLLSGPPDWQDPEARGLKSPSDGVIHGEQLPWLLALVGGLRERRVELKGQAESVRHTHRAVLQG